MAKLFISFLGTNDYLNVNYLLNYKGNDYKFENVVFIQEAILKTISGDFKDSDRCFVFVTKEAYNSNWITKENKQGLFDVIQNMNLNFSVEQIEIPIGIDEKEIWNIFEIIFEKINEGDEIYIDITHAFRFIPMLGMLLLNYSKFLKNIKVKAIYYGALEKLGTVRDVKEMDILKRDVSVLNLINFSKLQEWTNASDIFINFGDSDRLSNLMYQSVNNIMMENNKNKDATDIIDLGKNLNLFCQNIKTSRGEFLKECNEIAQIQRYIQNIKNNSETIKPLIPVISKINEKVSKFDKDDLNNGFIAVEWCLKHNLIQQGITLLLETIISVIINQFGKNYNNYNLREEVSNCINGTIINDFSKDIFEYMDEFDLLIFNLKELKNLRNDVNHGGFVIGYNQEPQKANYFKQKLDEIYKSIRENFISKL